MAVSALVHSTGKSRSNRCKHRTSPISSLSKLNLSDFYPSNKPLAQSTWAQAATKLVAILCLLFIAVGYANADSSDTSSTNSQINAGNTATLQSGKDTTLSGAVVAANTIKVEIGGNLTIQSLQDTSSSSYTSKKQSQGASITIGPGGVPTGGSISASKSNINSNFNSVNEQSGLKAGDGGFQVNV